ncbi:chitinase [Bacillus sp. FJAT-27225]|uniref:LysM peptidoglycan-binding domain-containing protein n=1 Tax=Bacillus sp. FJAT-27225 TaxID=1743144 RepID=UPI00080C2F20|nr:LysM peptidoglycan-binding domain-containing protein [Bacillus sp. FJAT-27225]OCA81661.1 chitinase [Bacillus sp. FJAT-27225]
MTVQVVTSGDYLWAIANRYNTTVSNIINVNGLESANLVPGLALYIPGKGLANRSYRIKKGDVLSRIAKRFNTTVAVINEANPDIDKNKLQIGQTIQIPSPIKMSTQILGFLVPSGTAADLPVITSLANQLTYIAVVNYTFTPGGWAYVVKDDRAIINRAKQLNVTPLMMVRNFTNSGFSPELAGGVLGNATYRQNLVASLVNLARTRGYGGISLDIEFIPPERRNEFNSFLQALKQQMGNLILNVNVHAKTEDMPTNRIVGAYDYATIGRISDSISVMTLDYGYPGGPPAPVSPINWVEQVVMYATGLVPPQKLFIAIPLYGYDKVAATNKTTGLSVLAAQNKAITSGAMVQFDPTAQSPKYNYWAGSEEHLVWFEDIRSYISKYNLIDSYQLAGSTLWQIGLPAPQNWAYLRNEVTVSKNRR